jgi:ATP/GTP-binding family protein
MIKPAKDGTPGIPVQTILTPTEVKHRLHDTNVRFDEYFSKGIL